MDKVANVAQKANIRLVGIILAVMLLANLGGLLWAQGPLFVPSIYLGSSGQCRVTADTGSPEGAVTGNQCDVFLRSDGGAGTTLYVKETGSGNTGWVSTAAGGGGGTAAIGVVIDGGGSAITTGFKGCSYLPYAGTITAATIIAHDAASPTSGSIVIDVWVDDFASYIPTDADSITASAPPTLTTSTTSTDSTLTGWTDGFSAGDVFCFNVDSATDVEKVTLTLTVTKS